MTNAKESVLDRIEQSFILLKQNFIELFLPIFLYKLVSIVLFGGVATYYFFWNLWKISDNSLYFFSSLNDPFIVLSVAIGIFLFLLYLLLYIPILLGLIQSIKQAYNWEKITWKQNVFYWFSRFSNSMKTYWYIFSYVALLPSIIFIIWWLLFNLGFYFPNFEIGKYIGWAIMVFSWVLFFIFALYRGIRASFPLFSAVDRDIFTKNNFLYSVSITNGNWLRVLWNFILVWFIIWLSTSFISGTIWVFIPSSIDFDSIKSIDNLKSIWDSFSIVPYIISTFFSSIINIIWDVFIIVFTYIFFKRLCVEKWEIQKNDIDLNQEL